VAGVRKAADSGKAADSSKTLDLDDLLTRAAPEDPGGSPTSSLSLSRAVAQDMGQMRGSKDPKVELEEGDAWGAADSELPEIEAHEDNSTGAELEAALKLLGPPSPPEPQPEEWEPEEIPHPPEEAEIIIEFGEELPLEEMKEASEYPHVSSAAPLASSSSTAPQTSSRLSGQGPVVHSQSPGESSVPSSVSPSVSPSRISPRRRGGESAERTRVKKIFSLFDQEGAGAIEGADAVEEFISQLQEHFSDDLGDAPIQFPNQQRVSFDDFFVFWMARQRAMNG
jgi:hypothetical protein